VKKQQLIEDNMKLVYYIVRRDYPTYIADEDIIQCGMLGLCRAAEKWDETKSKFSTFASKCIKNEIGQEFRRRAKHQGILSLDYEVDGDDGEKCSFGDCIVSEEDIGYVDLSIDFQRLTKRELEICELCKQGLSYEDIGKQLGVSKQIVWKTVRKIRALRGAEE
jgi:RNA polymerase sigma factor (sigma-70 family)